MGVERSSVESLGANQNRIPVSEVGYNRNEVIIHMHIEFYQVMGVRKSHRAEF